MPKSRNKYYTLLTLPSETPVKFQLQQLSDAQYLRKFSRSPLQHSAHWAGIGHQPKSPIAFIFGSYTAPPATLNLYNFDVRRSTSVRSSTSVQCDVSSTSVKLTEYDQKALNCMCYNNPQINFSINRMPSGNPALLIACIL